MSEGKSRQWIMNYWRAIAAATALIVMASNSTSTSALFVAYRARWSLTAADIGLAFSVYVGTLIPVLLIFGGCAERFGRRPVVLAGMLFMAAGTLMLVIAHGLPQLIGGVCCKVWEPPSESVRFRRRSPRPIG